MEVALEYDRPLFLPVQLKRTFGKVALLSSGLADGYKVIPAPFENYP